MSSAIAVLMRLFRATDRENWTPCSTQAVITVLAPNAESTRSMIVRSPRYSRAFADGPPRPARRRQRPEPALPLRSRASALSPARPARSDSGGDLRGQAQPSAARRLGDRRRASNEAPCLRRTIDRAQHRVDVSRSPDRSMPGNSRGAGASAARCSRATAASWLACPKVNSAHERSFRSVEGRIHMRRTRRGRAAERATRPKSSMHRHCRRRRLDHSPDGSSTELPRDRVATPDFTRGAALV